VLCLSASHKSTRDGCYEPDPNAASHAQSRLEHSLEYYDFKKEGCEVKIVRICFPTDVSNTADLIGEIMKKEEAPGNS
jgi:hypothetical protein